MGDWGIAVAGSRFRCGRDSWVGNSIYFDFRYLVIEGIETAQSFSIVRNPELNLG